MLTGFLHWKRQDWTTTQIETRYGCFLPDLTGLARDLSAASLPAALYQQQPQESQARTDRIIGETMLSPRA